MTHVSIEISATLLVSMDEQDLFKAREIANQFVRGFDDASVPEPECAIEWTLANVVYGRPYLVALEDQHERE